MHMSLTQLARTLSRRVRLASESHIAAYIPLNGVHIPLGTGEASHWLPALAGDCLVLTKQAVISVRQGVARLCSIILIIAQREIQH
jgi:hypothetical protein